MTSVIEVLEGARDLIARPNGWCRHAFIVESEAGVAYCPVGAIRETSNFTQWEPKNDAYYGAMRYLRRAIPGQRMSIQQIFSYNDDPARIKDEIIAWFDAAIEVAKKEQECHAGQQFSLS